MKKNNFYLFALLFVLGVAKVFAQTNARPVDPRALYIFSEDSLQGFDEHSASAAALANGCYGTEFKVFMFREKRRFINQKYNIQERPAYKPAFTPPVYTKSSALPSSGSCSNEDFEDATSGQIVAPGAVNGWVITSTSSGANFCNPPATFAANLYTVYNGPISDANIGAAAGSASIISSYFDAVSNTQPSGSCFIRLNDAFAGAKAVQMKKTFTVTPNNALFQYAFKAVIEDGGHSCCDQPGLKIRATITNTATSSSTVLACPQISVAVPGPSCVQPTNAATPAFLNGVSPWKYNNWFPSAIDLSPYIGFQVEIDVFAIDCSFSGHGAYVYFDAKCSPMTILGNGNSFPAGTPFINIPTCGAA
ncbi:MAG: hypothetical protein QM534_18895, partial [Sediminibacterium sp.]|nr:hypothetical protein [Sediminibacterium sp.]